VQPPQEPQAGQPAFPGYGAPPAAAQPPAAPYGGPVPPYGYYTTPAYGYGQPLPAPQTSSFAIASLVCSLASWFVIPFIGAIAAVVLGHIARHEIRHSYGQKSGSGLAIAGLVIGYIQIALALLGGLFLLWIFIVLAANSSP
jgi:hypothetical protein